MKIIDVVQTEIDKRSKEGHLLAKKFPELKGLSWEEFLENLPMELNFITASEMFDALNEVENSQNKHSSESEGTEKV